MKKRIFLFLLIAFSLFINYRLSAQEKSMVKKSSTKISSESKNVSVPEWAKKVVWYQVFPERFRNGDASNDPTIETLTGSYPHDTTSPWEIHPWNSDWYKLQDYEKKNGKDIWFNLQRRRYGGDLQGIIDKLDYLKDLGIGAIYINPVFESPSLHKYDGATYHHIDPNFGPTPETDRILMQKEDPGNSETWLWTSADKLFLKLIDEVHKRGMKIIIDGVFNHMGINSWAFRDVVKNQEKSKYKDWFSIKSFNDSAKGTEFKYDGWFGVKELPELKEDENGIVKGPREYIFNITHRWMDPNEDGDPSDGIDGWRLDVAFCIQHQFWKDWRKVVKSINPDAYVTAEVIDSIDVIKPYLLGDEFDAVMNYNFYFACSEFFVDDSTAISVSKFDSLLQQLRESFDDEINYVQQNLLGSHDTQRIASQIVNRDKYKIRSWGKSFDLTKGSNPNYSTRKPTEEDYNRFKLMLIFQMTYLGAPYVYYGDEVGMWGANDPDCRKPMVWDDINYEPESTLPNQTNFNPSDNVNANKDLFQFYKKLIHIRNEYDELQVGDFKSLIIDDESGIYVYSRTLGEKEIIVAINKGDDLQTIKLKTNHREYYKDLLNKSPIIEVKNNQMEFQVPAKRGKILLKDYYK
jgi:cyclomaltodextrinase / maltogenic alpha-amylase / neopullulanase